MTTVLVVNHDIDVADQQADSLRRHGYDVIQCGGPIGAACPILEGRPCSIVERADVLLYDVWATGEAGGAEGLITTLREMHPSVPIVLAAPGMELGWVETEGIHGVTPLVGTANGARLADVLARAVQPTSEGGYLSA